MVTANEIFQVKLLWTLSTKEILLAMGDIHYSRSNYWEFRFWGQRVNWSVRMLYLMAAEKNDVTQSVQNSTADCGSTVADETFAEDKVPGASLNVRKAGSVKVSELKSWLVC